MEKSNRQLEHSPKEVKALTEKVTVYVDQFLKNLHHMNAFNLPEKENNQDKKKLSIERKPLKIDETLSSLNDLLVKPGLNTASGNNMGYIPGGGIYTAALGDYLAAVTNKYAGVYYAAPGAVNIENEIIKWAAHLIGYNENSGGNLTSGGSYANLIALYTARQTKKIKAKDIPKAVVYCSHQAHHSIQKALRLIGMDESVIRYIKTDAQHRMVTFDLEAKIKEDHKAKLIPFLIVANAGSTDVGAVDPLQEIAALAGKHNLWFHVDAAYGGFFMLTKKGRKKLNGINLADSVILDPHKSLFMPYGSGMLLVKEVKHLLNANNLSGSYLQDAAAHAEELSPSQLSPELSKHFRGLRVWLPLKLYGTEVFAAYLNEKLDLTDYFYDNIKKMGFEVNLKPDLTTIAFRYIPSKGDANDYNKWLINEIQKSGESFISSTTIDGHFTLRTCVLSFRTHKKEVTKLLNLLDKFTQVSKL